MLKTPNSSINPTQRPLDRRLLYLVLSAFRQANDQHDDEVTQGLLNILIGIISSSDKYYSAL